MSLSPHKKRWDTLQPCFTLPNVLNVLDGCARGGEQSQKPKNINRRNSSSQRIARLRESYLFVWNFPPHISLPECQSANTVKP